MLTVFLGILTGNRIFYLVILSKYSWEIALAIKKRMSIAFAPGQLSPGEDTNPRTSVTCEKRERASELMGNSSSNGIGNKFSVTFPPYIRSMRSQ